MFQLTDRQQQHPRDFAGTSGRRTLFVRCGEKDYYNPADPADVAELRTVQAYRQR